MCGIFGIFTPHTAEIPDHDQVDRLTDLLSHRGPDDRGVWQEPGIALGHRRLAIIDPTGSPQPMTSPDSRYVLIYNGEVYNFRELRRELESTGIHFLTIGDTEVVLQSLTLWGTDALVRFNGMFALALYDRREKRLLLARDRLGVKPLLYAEKDGALAFASEFAPLLELDWVDGSPDPLGVAAYLAHYQLTFNHRTIYRGIRSLEPGEYLIADSDGVHIHRYWQLPVILSAEKEAQWPPTRIPEAAEQLAALMRDAVTDHLIADVPVGAFLSGGLDSAIVLTLMADAYPEQVRAYSIGFDEEGYNEFQYSQPLVEALNLRHELIRFDSADYLPLMRELIAHKRAPLSTPNEVPLLVLSRRLASDIKVVLSGEGSDELMGGYAGLLRSPHDYEAALSLRLNPQAYDSTTRAAIRDALRRLYGKTGFADPLDHFLSAYAWTTPDDRKAILSPDFYTPDVEAEITAVWRDRFDRLDGLSHYDQYLYLLETEHLRGLLTRLDAETMAASVEGRVPFCDSRLVDFVWSLPFDYKLRWKDDSTRATALGKNSVEIAEELDIAKFILKEAFRDRIPPTILARRKKAFPVPLETILNRDVLNNIFYPANNRDKHKTLTINRFTTMDWIDRSVASGQGWMKVWMALNLSLWQENK